MQISYSELTFPIEYSLFVQAAQNYNQILSFAAINMSPDKFVRELRACPDNVTVENLHANSTSQDLLEESDIKERVKDLRKLKRDLITVIERRISEAKKLAGRQALPLVDSAIILTRHLRSYRAFTWEEGGEPEEKNSEQKNEGQSVADGPGNNATKVFFHFNYLLALFLFGSLKSPQ